MALVNVVVNMSQMSAMVEGAYGAMGMLPPAGGEATIGLVCVTLVLTGSTVIAAVLGGYKRMEVIMTALLVVILLCFIVVAIKGLLDWRTWPALAAGLVPTIPADLPIFDDSQRTRNAFRQIMAIAGQALVGHGLGGRDPERVRLVTRRLVLLGIAGGVLLGVLTLAVSGVLGPAFSDSRAVRDALPVVLVLIAVGMPVAGYVFVLDGVLIGAGDARYLAIAGGVNLVVYLPLLWWAGGTLAGLWAAFALGYIGVRAVTLGVRAHRRGWVEQALAR
jgi:Na+-driven multidrug efflux pump